MVSSIAGIVAAALALSSSAPLPQQASGSIQPGRFEGKVTRTVTYNYLVALPEGYADRRERVPLILFLHGSGERGTDVNAVKVHGPLKEIERGRKIPAVVVAPQCPPRGWWDADALTALIDRLERKYRIDRDRIYVTGLSMGGFGTWELGTRNPGRFAALAPICGGGQPEDAAKLATVPIWVVHGDADTSVPIAESERMIAAVQKAGNTRVQFTVVKGGGHDVWTDVYASDAFYTWLFAQRRGR